LKQQSAYGSRLRAACNFNLFFVPLFHLRLELYQNPRFEMQNNKVAYKNTLIILKHQLRLQHSRQNHKKRLASY